MNITTRQGFTPQTMTEAMEFSKTLASSSMVPRAYQGKPEDILVCVQWGMEIGLAPMQALQNIAVINGKPSVYGDAALALVQASPVCEDIEERIDGEGTGNLVAVCVAHRKGRKPVTAMFSVEDAKRAGLWGRQGPWTSYPKRMLQMRARGFALRDAFPDVLKGLITAEEAQDYPVEKEISAKQAPSNPLDVIAAPVEIVEEKIEEVIEQPEEITVEEVQNVLEGGPFKLMVPGKDEPIDRFQTMQEWEAAYEKLADRTARAGKISPRDRMTKLKELRLANLKMIEEIPANRRIQHVAEYSKRLAALGAAMNTEA